MEHSLSRSNLPLVTIVVPSFNQGAFLEKTLLSIFTQEYKFIEVIVIDGGSSDNSLQILRKYKDKLTWISEPDRGPADAVNKGFSMGHGQICSWINSDDIYFDKNSILKIVDAFLLHSDMDIIYGNAAIISANDVLLRYWFVPPYDQRRIVRGNMIVQPAVFLKTYIATQNKLSVGCLPLDYDLWLRLGKKGYKFLHIHDIIACDRYHPERLSTKKRSELIKSSANLQGRFQSKKPNKLILCIDRFAQLLCRLEGLWSILFGYKKLKNNNLIVIDSFSKLLFRQTLHSVIFDEIIE